MFSRLQLAKFAQVITQTLLAFLAYIYFIPDHTVPGPFVAFCPDDEVVLWQSLTKVIIYELLWRTELLQKHYDFF